MANNTDRRSFLVAAGTVTTTAVAGCLDSDDDESETDGGELQLVSDAIQTMDPIGVVGADRAWLNWQVHEPLFIHKNGLPPAEGLLAEDYDISGDYLTYTFTLKEGVMFHDGSELTAADVIYSWRRLAESENNRGNANNIVGNVMNISHEEDGDEVVPDSMEIEAVDKYTIEMRLETPFQNVLSHLASLLFSVIPEGVVGDIDGYDGEMDYDEWATEALYGTGPFKLEEWRDGDTVTLTRFDEYHGSVANIDGISAQIIEDSNARYTVAINEQNADLFTIPQAEFNPGLLDVTTEIDGNRKEGSYGPADGETLNYGQMSRPRTQYLIFNTLQVDPAARRAIAYAFDQETATAQATDGLGQPAYFLTPPSAFPDGPENYDRIAETEYP